MSDEMAWAATGNDEKWEETREERTAPSWLALAVMLTGTFMTVMDVMIVNVAIPSIRRTLGAGVGQAELVVAGYAMTYAVALITGGRLGDIHGRRRMFRVGLAAFTGASLLCGVAPTATALVLARLLQGVGAAMLFPQVFSLIRVTFTDAQERARAFAILGVALGLAAIVGQLLGGALIEADLWGLSWRPIFLVNIPIGLAAWLLAPLVLTESRSPLALRLDGGGVALCAVGLGLLLYPLIEGREAGWPLWSLVMLAAATPVLALFAGHQHGKSRRRESPLVETTLFRERAFTVGVLLVLVFYSTINSVYLSFAFLLQSGLGWTPLQAGLAFAGPSLAFMVASLTAGRQPPRRRRAVLLTGAAAALTGNLLAVAVSFAGAVPPGATALVAPMVVLGLGQGLVMTPLINAVLGAIGEAHAGSAAGTLSTMQQVGGAIGVAVVGILYFATLDHARAAGLAEAAAYTRAYGVAALYAAVATTGVLALVPRLPHGGQA